jgi:hypothetical protein
LEYKDFNGIFRIFGDFLIFGDYCGILDFFSGVAEFGHPGPASTWIIGIFEDFWEFFEFLRIFKIQFVPANPNSHKPNTTWILDTTWISEEKLYIAKPQKFKNFSKILKNPNYSNAANFSNTRKKSKTSQYSPKLQKILKTPFKSSKILKTPKNLKILTDSDNNPDYSYIISSAIKF